MKLILAALLISSVSFGAASTTPVAQQQGLQPVFVTDSFGNGLLDQVNANALSVSLGSTVGKTIVGQGSTLATAATTYAEVLTYTTTGGKTFYITGFGIEGGLSTASATASTLGYCSLQVPRGTTVAKYRLYNATHGAIDRILVSPAEPVAVQAATTVVVSCIPQFGTSMIWGGNVIGYEK